MPIFAAQLGRVENGDPAAAIRRLASHVRSLQEQLEYTLMNLDSSNITEIETDRTEIRSSDGSASFAAGGISFSGSGGESFQAGGTEGGFRFVLRGRGGTQQMYLNGEGQLVITGGASVTVDGGEW